MDLAGTPESPRVEGQHSCVLTDNPCLFYAEMAILFDLMPTQIRSYFPESWLWEVQPVR